MTSGQLLHNQSAIVTGGDSGIGEACSKALAESGAAVCVNFAHNESAAKKVVDEIIASGGRAFSIQGDVSDEAQVESLFGECVKAFGTVDILVNNAGLQKDAPIGEMTLSQWNTVIGVNLTGQFLCARAAIREFRRRGARPDISLAVGKIICMSSVHQQIPWGGHTNYASSKGGVKLLMESLAQEVGSERIRVNGIAPGAIKTPINHDAWATPEAEAKLLKLIPYSRVGVPKDISNAVVWLCSDLSDYVHGTTLFVDGGMTLYPGFSDNG